MTNGSAKCRDLVRGCASLGDSRLRRTRRAESLCPYPVVGAVARAVPRHWDSVGPGRTLDPAPADLGRLVPRCGRVRPDPHSRCRPPLPRQVGKVMRCTTAPATSEIADAQWPRRQAAPGLYRGGMGKKPRRRHRPVDRQADRAVEQQRQHEVVPIVELKGGVGPMVSKSLIIGRASAGKTDTVAFVTAALGPAGRRSFQLPGITSQLHTLEGPRARQVRRAQSEQRGERPGGTSSPAGFDAASVLARMDAAGASDALLSTEEIVETVRSLREGAE